jgi:hypothetical protein
MPLGSITFSKVEMEQVQGMCCFFTRLKCMSSSVFIDLEIYLMLYLVLTQK